MGMPLTAMQLQLCDVTFATTDGSVSEPMAWDGLCPKRNESQFAETKLQKINSAAASALLGFLQSLWENHPATVNNTWMSCKSEQPKICCCPLALTCMSVFRSEASHRWFISNKATADKTPKQFSAWVITANLLQMLNRWNLYMTSPSINTSTLSYFNCWCNNTMWLFPKGKYMNLGVWLFVFSEQ